MTRIPPLFFKCSLNAINGPLHAPNCHLNAVHCALNTINGPLHAANCHVNAVDFSLNAINCPLHVATKSWPFCCIFGFVACFFFAILQTSVILFIAGAARREGRGRYYSW